jgi:hypothetical protein
LLGTGERVDGRGSLILARTPCPLVCRDTPLNKVSPHDLGGDSHDDVVPRLDGGDLLVEPARRTADAARPCLKRGTYASLIWLVGRRVVAIGVRHQHSVTCAS